MKTSSGLMIGLCLLSTTIYANNNRVTLHGKITHPLADSISVSYPDSWLGYETKTITARLNSDGTFVLTFLQANPFTNVMIKHGVQGTEIAPAPGDDLVLTVDAGNFDSTIHYSGKGSEVANFMAAHMIERSFTSMFSSRMQGASGYAPDSFLARIHTSLQKEEDFLEKNGARLPAAFKKAWITNFRYGMYVGMLNYPVFHEIQKQKSYSISSFDTADFGPVLQVPGVFDDELLCLSYYRQYATIYYNEQLNARDRQSGLQPRAYDSAAHSLCVANMPPQTAELYEASHIYEQVKTTPYATLVPMLSAFNGMHPNSRYLATLDEKIAQKKKLSAGSPELDFQISTADGSSHKLSDFKGKVVFLDFWATWCGPCMGEMTYARKIEDQYKDKDVVFVYVSIDADDRSWKKGLEKLQLDGVHMRDGDGGWHGPVATAYGLNSVPSYYLIDKQGFFAMDATPRPSQTSELVAAIDKLLK